MVLIALSHIVILLELLVWLVIVGKNVCAIELALNAEMVIGSPGKSTLTVGRLDDALGKGHRGRYAVPAHLLHRVLRILVNVLLS